MELLNALRAVLRQRILLAVGLLIAVALGGLVGGFLVPRGAEQTSAEALGRVLVDTRQPLAGTATRGLGADTITQRSVLLADSMASPVMTATIGGRAKVPSGQLAVLGPVLDPVSIGPLLPDGMLPQLAGAAAETSLHDPYVVRLVTDNAAPVIIVGAAAPDHRAAASLAQATIAALELAAHQAGGAHAAVDVEQLGPVRTVVVKSSSSSHVLLGLVAALAVFAVWSAGIAVASGLGNRGRHAAPVAEIVW